MRKPSGRFSALKRKHGKGLHYAAEGVLIEVTEQISTLLEARGMTRAELAQALGCSKAYITKLLAGSQNLTLESLSRLAMTLKTRLVVQLVPLGTDIPGRLRGTTSYCGSPRVRLSSNKL